MEMITFHKQLIFFKIECFVAKYWEPLRLRSVNELNGIVLSDVAY